MKTIRLYIVLSFIYSLFGCKYDNKKETVKIEGQEIETKVSENFLSPTYSIEDLNENTLVEFEKLNSEAIQFIQHYSKETKDIFNSKNLDEILEIWKIDTNENKVKFNKTVDLIGYAFGTDIANSLNCEWKILNDEYGKDFTVIHKKFKINCFPFSSVQKAIKENRIGSLNDIKLILKKNIQDAENGNEIEVRK